MISFISNIFLVHAGHLLVSANDRNCCYSYYNAHFIKGNMIYSVISSIKRQYIVLVGTSIIKSLFLYHKLLYNVNYKNIV